MSIRVTFVDGNVVEYPDGAGSSVSADGHLKFINDSSGQVIATLVTEDVKEAIPS